MVLSNTAVPREYGAFRDAVLRGEIPVNKEISMQMNIIDAMVENPDFYYDDEAIDGYIRFCENELTLTNGEDLTLLPTFKLWAEDALAWFYYADEKVYNPRLHRYEMVQTLKRLRHTQYLIVARGNSKSLYESTMQAYFLINDPKTTHQVTVAPTMTQANEIMQPLQTAITRAKGPLFQMMTEGSINSRTHQCLLASTKKGIENKATGSLLEVRTMRRDALQGLRSKYATVDEWLSGDVKEDVVGALQQSAAKGDDASDYMIFAVSSEGTVRDSVGDSIKMKLQKTLRGEYYDPHTSIWYYRLDDVQEVANPDMWMKACPNIGITVSYETYEQEVRLAEASPAERNDILAKRFGIPVEGYTYFFTYEETLPHPPRDYFGLECAMGMDASQGDDFWAFSWLFPLPDGRFGVDTRSYVSQAKVDRLPSATKQKYEELVREGSLVIMDEAYLDWNKVYDDIAEHCMANQYTVLTFGYDPYFAKPFMEKWATEFGEYGIEVVRQGAKTESVPLGELKNLSLNRQLLFHQELMKFAMGNSVVIEDNNGNRKLSKKRSEEKIDNFAALMDAWIAYKRNQEVFMVNG